MRIMSNNPFTPNIGQTPVCFAGRDDFLQEFEYALDNASSDPALFSVIVGPSGIGKTALLEAASDIACAKGWISARAMVTDNLLTDVLDSVRLSASHLLDPDAKLQMKSVDIDIRLLKVKFSKVEESEGSWLTEMESCLSKLSAMDIGVLVCVDEISSPCTCFDALLKYCQLLRSRGYKLALLGAGLSRDVEDLLQKGSASFQKRLQRRLIGALSPEEARRAIAETVAYGGKDISTEALNELTSYCQGHPYVLQLVGYYTWREAKEEAIHLEIARRGMAVTSGIVAQRVIEPQLQAIKRSELCYLEVLARNEGSASPGKMAEELDISIAEERVLRTRLQQAGLLSSGGSQASTVSFSVPLVCDYMNGRI